LAEAGVAFDVDVPATVTSGTTSTAAALATRVRFMIGPFVDVSAGHRLREEELDRNGGLR
jgi:hypothetical protein